MTPLLDMHAGDAAVCFGGEGTRTRAQLGGDVAALARALPTAAAGSLVVVAAQDRYRFIVALLSCWSRGYAVALPSNGQEDVVHALLARTSALTLLHDRDGGSGIDVRGYDGVHNAEPTPLALGLRSESSAVVAFTSGSSGEPQAHPKTLGQLLDETRALVAHFALEDQRVISAVPPFHIYGLLFGVLAPLMAGGATSRTSPLLPRDLAALAKHECARVLVAVPPHLRAIAHDSDASWPVGMRVFSSGASLADSLADTLAAQGFRVTQILGSTETGGIASRSAAGAPFVPLPGVEVTRGETGLLLVDAPWLDPTAPRPLATQDRITWVHGGFALGGRADAVVKVGGRRVDLGDIEAQLRSLPGVRDARVLAQETAHARGVELQAVVEGEGLEAGALRQALTRRLDPVTVPRRFRIVPQLPRTSAGKVSRRALLALFDDFAFSSELQADGSVQVPIPPTLGYFRGHFDGTPVLPGIVQLQQLALAEARRRWPELGAVSRLTRVKFKRPIEPGDTLTLNLERKTEQLVRFDIRSGSDPASSGLIHFRGTPA